MPRHRRRGRVRIWRPSVPESFLAGREGWLSSKLCGRLVRGPNREYRPGSRQHPPRSVRRAPAQRPPATGKRLLPDGRTEGSARRPAPMTALLHTPATQTLDNWPVRVFAGDATRPLLDVDVNDVLDEALAPAPSTVRTPIPAPEPTAAPTAVPSRLTTMLPPAEPPPSSDGTFSASASTAMPSSGWSSPAAVSGGKPVARLKPRRSVRTWMPWANTVPTNNRIHRRPHAWLCGTIHTSAASGARITSTSTSARRINC